VGRHRRSRHAPNGPTLPEGVRQDREPDVNTIIAERMELDRPDAPKGQLQISPGQSVAAEPRRAALGNNAPQDASPQRGTTSPRTGCDHEQLRTGYNWMALDSRASTGKTNGNESATVRVTPAFGSFRRTISRVSDAFVAQLFRPFRATDNGGDRLPRATLGGCAASLCPGLTCFAPSGQGGA
jgi:hypothetical protein